MESHLITENLERKDAVEFLAASGVDRTKALKMSDDALAVAYDVIKRQANKKTKTIHYCQCGQAVRLRKRDNKWVHYGYKKMHEPYAEFLERTAHPVEVTESKEWIKE